MDPISHEQRIAYIEARRDHTVHGLLGVRIVSYDPVTVEIDVDERLHQEAGIVHGGVFMLLAESAASIQAAMEVDLARVTVSGQSFEAHHLRPVRDGRLRATSRLLHAGSTRRLYDVDVVTEDGRVASTARVTMAVRPWPGGEPAMPAT